MRLKLNRTLRAALIAAITAVGFTLSQAQADQVTYTDMLKNNTSDWTITRGGSINANEGKYTNSGWNKGTASYNFEDAITLTATTDTLTFSYDVEVRANAYATFTLVSNGGCTITTGWGNSDNDKRIGYGTSSYTSATDVYQFKDSEANVLKVDRSEVFSSTGYNTFAVSGTIAWSAENNSYVLTMTSTPGGADAETKTIVLNKSSLTFTDMVIAVEGKPNSTYYVSNVGFSATYTPPVFSSMTWQGTEQSHAWSDAVWTGSESGQTYVSGTDVVFDNTAAYKTVLVKEATVAGKITVSDTYEIQADGGNLTTTKIVIEAGDSLTITGTGADSGAATISSLSGAGNLTVGANGVATVNAIENYTGTLAVTNGGTLSLGFGLNCTSYTVEGGTLNLGSNRHTIGTLTIGDGGLVTTTRHDGSGCVSGDIDIKAGGTFRVAGQHDAFGWGGNATKNIILTGESETKRAELQFRQTTDNSATFATNLKLMGHALVSTTKNGFNTYGGSIYAEGVDNTIQKFQLRSAATIEVKAGGELTVGDMEYGVETDHHLTKTGAGSLTFTGTAVMKKLNLLDGSLIIKGGTTTVNGADQGDANPASVLNKTIDVQAGSLVLKGIFEIGGNTGEMETTYVGGATEGNGNGFEHVAGSSKVYTKAAEGASVNVEGATFSVDGQDVTSAVVDGVYTTTGTTTYDTFYVKSGAESLDHALTYAGEHTVSTVSLANGTTINADRADATIGLALASGVSSATVNASKATTISSIEGWSDNKLTITGEGAVSLLPGQALTKQLTGTTALKVDTTVTTAKLYLYEDNASLTVGEHGVLNINASTGNSNNLTLRHGTAEVSGTVNVGHELDLSDGGKNVGATGKLHILGTGNVTAGVGMWMYSTAGGVLLEEGGTLTITDKSVKFTGKEGGSIKVADGKEMNYNVGNADALISNVTMEALGNITIANQLTNVDVVTGAHSVTLNSNAASVIVSDGGTFTLGEGRTVTNITVEDGGTIAGGVDAKDVAIAAGGTATFDDGIHEAGVDIEGWGSGATVKNTGDATAKYTGLQDSNMKVTADTLYALHEEAVVIDNALEVGIIMHDGTAALTLTKVNAEVLEGVYANAGTISLQNTQAVSLTEMEIASGSTVQVTYTDEQQAAQEGTVTITGTLFAGGSTLLANLTIADADLEDGANPLLNVNGGGDNALTLGSQFTIAEGTLVTLDNVTIAALEGMQIGQSLDIIRALEETELTYGEDGQAIYDGMWFGQLFERVTGVEGDYLVYANDTAFGLTKVSKTPEPTTGTLSLLALMALAARRRRK